jgi:exopolysaccharide production protein ExoZ
MTSRQGAGPLISLQYLRAIASMFVVYLHAAIQVNTLSGAGVSPWPEVGKCGVDVFFVLSGYVMWMSTAGRSGVLEFLRRRLVRIAPLYWIVTLAAASVALVAPHLLNSTRFEIRHVVASLCFIPWRNPVVPYEAGGDMTEILKPIISPGWTLNFEMFFYAQFALALLVPERKRLATLVLIITGVYLACSSLAGQADIFQFYGSRLVFEFLAGSVLASIAGGADNGTQGIALPVSALCISLVVILLNDAWFSASARAIALGGPAVVLVASAVEIEKRGRLPFVRLLDQLGNASYSIYITHIFSVAGMRIFPRMLGLDPLGLGRPFFVAGCLALAAVGGFAVHMLVEKPLLRILNRNRLPVAMTVVA